MRQTLQQSMKYLCETFNFDPNTCEKYPKGKQPPKQTPDPTADKSKAAKSKGEDLPVG